MEKLHLREHIDHVIQCTKELGLSQSTFDHYLRHYEAVFLYCTENGIDPFTYQQAADLIKTKYGMDPRSWTSSAKDARKAAYTIARYFENGRFSWKATTFTTHDPASEEYKELMAHFKQELSKRLSPGTVRPEMIIVRQSLCFLEQANVPDALSITSENVLDFVRQEALDHRGSMPRLLRTLRDFVCFLRAERIVNLDADRFLGTAGRCRQKAMPCFFSP